MHRRDLLKSAMLASASALLARAAGAQGAAAPQASSPQQASSPAPAVPFAPRPGAWRTFQVTTRLDLDGGPAEAWVPLPNVNESAWFRSLDSTWTGNGAKAEVTSANGATALHVVWPDGTAAPHMEVTSRIATRDRAVDLAVDPAVDLAASGQAAPLAEAERRLYLAGTEFIPVDSIVKETADRIVAGRLGDVERARAIYEWVVDNSYRNAATRGCGTGDVGAMLRSGNLGGKCADLNALFVGLARAAGLPARDVYGLRVAPSQFGYKSLGAGSDIVTKAQHCRAEVYLSGLGWVAADPADVRKVVLEEPPGKLALDDAKVVAARKVLFGGWEGNWLAYNFAHDVALPGAAGPKLAFLMYPQAEIRGARLDCLDPDTFKYSIRASEVSA